MDDGGYLSPRLQMDDGGYLSPRSQVKSLYFVIDSVFPSL